MVFGSTVAFLGTAALVTLVALVTFLGMACVTALDRA